jgi:hypothetical protein
MALPILVDAGAGTMRKLVKKESPTGGVETGAVTPAPFYRNDAPVTCGLVARPRPRLSERTRSGETRRPFGLS